VIDFLAFLAIWLLPGVVTCVPYLRVEMTKKKPANGYLFGVFIGLFLFGCMWLGSLGWAFGLLVWVG